MCQFFGLVTQSRTAKNRMLMPNQIDITIRKELAMTAPPPAFLSKTMRSAAESSAVRGTGRRSHLPKFSSSTKPGHPGQAQSNMPDRMTKPFAGTDVQRRL